jgi:hypothetical protein
MALAQNRKSRKGDRRTPDLSKLPDLVVIYLGMRVKSPRGIKTLLSFGARIRQAVAESPNGLLPARRRLRREGEEQLPSVFSEEELYGASQ